MNSKLCLLLITLSISIYSSAQIEKPIGINLASVKDWSTEFVFTDAFKQSRGWISANADGSGPWSTNVEIPLGPKGYPLEIPYDNGIDPPQKVRTLMIWDIGDAVPTGTYRLKVNGSGKVKLKFGVDGTFDTPIDTLVANVDGKVGLEILESDASNPIDDIKFIYPDYVNTYQNQTFYPKLISFLDDFQVIRYMDWLQTNNSDVETWSDRTPPTYRTQTVSSGVAWEYVIQLANTTQTDIWINIPHKADDQYINNLAQMISNDLNSDLRIYLEYSNEVWNGMFDQHQEAANLGDDLGYTGQEWDRAWKYTAKRSADIFHIFENFIVDKNRLVKLIPGWSNNNWVSNKIIEHFENPTYNPYGVEADALAIAPYFNDGVAGDIVDDGVVSSITIPEIIDRLENDLQESFNEMQSNQNEAQEHGMGLVAYEGGQHLVAVSAANKNNDELTQKLTAANQHPDMKDVYCQYMNHWYENFGGLFAHFSSHGTYSKHGSWGLKVDYDDINNPKYKALKDCVFNSNNLAVSDEACPMRTNWDGTEWSNGTPDKKRKVVFENDYIVTDLEACSVKVTENNNLEIKNILEVDHILENIGLVKFLSDANGTGQFESFYGSIRGAGKFTIHRFIPAGDNDLRAFRFLSTAVNSVGTILENWQQGGLNPGDNGYKAGFGTHITGTTGPDGTNGFDSTGSGQASLLEFNNQTQTWGSITDTDPTELEAGNAYNLFVRGDRSVDLSASSADQTPTNTTLRSTGDLVTGNLVTGTDLPALASDEDEWSFIGNPYQSIVDITQVLNATNSTNLNTNFYWVWDPNKGSQGGYVTVDLSNGSNPGTSDANEFVQPGQSFFVQNSSTSGTNDLTFTESAKDVLETPTQVFSNNNQTSINLLLYTDQALTNNDSEADALGINFTPNANNGVDQIDAAKFTNIDENLARLNNGNLISIENRSMPVDGESLELFTNAYSGSNYTFVVNVSNLPDGVDAYLVDNYNTGNQTLLSDGANQISFTVDASIPDSVASDRFSIDFDVETFGVDDDNELADQISLYPNPTDGQFTIQTKGENTDRVVNIYDMNGKQIFQNSYPASSDEKLNVNAGNVTAGVYMVEMIGNKESFTTQLIIK